MAAAKASKITKKEIEAGLRNKTLIIADATAYKPNEKHKIWKHFGIPRDINDETRFHSDWMACKGCKIVYAWKKTGGYGTQTRHIEDRCPKRTQKGQMSTDHGCKWTYISKYRK